MLMILTLALQGPTVIEVQCIPEQTWAISEREHKSLEMVIYCIRLHAYSYLTFQRAHPKTEASWPRIGTSSFVLRSLQTQMSVSVTKLFLTRIMGEHWPHEAEFFSVPEQTWAISERNQENMTILMKWFYQSTFEYLILQHNHVSTEWRWLRNGANFIVKTVHTKWVCHCQSMSVVSDLEIDRTLTNVRWSSLRTGAKLSDTWAKHKYIWNVILKCISIGDFHT